MEALLYGDPRDDHEAERLLRRARRADVRRRLRANEHERCAWWRARPRVERLWAMVGVHGEHFLNEFQKWTDERLIATIVRNERHQVLLLIDFAPDEVQAELERLSSRE